MRCSYCRKEVIHGSVSCPDCGRACLLMVDPSADGEMEPSLMDAALTSVVVVTLVGIVEVLVQRETSDIVHWVISAFVIAIVLGGGCWIIYHTAR